MTASRNRSSEIVVDHGSPVFAWRVYLLKVLLVVFVIGIAVYHVGTDKLRQVLTLDTLVAIAAMQVFLFTATSFNVLRHAFLVTIPRAPFLSCFAAVLLSAGINLVTPARISEIVKATYLRLKLGIPLSNGTAAIVIERLFDICVVAMIGLVGFVGVFFDDPSFLFAVLAISILALAFMRPVTQLILPFVANRDDMISKFILGNCKHVIAVLTLKLSVLTMVLTCVSWLTHYFAIWLFFYVQPGVELSFSQAALVFGAIVFAGAIPSLPGGIGMIQAAVTLVLTKMGIPLGEALLLSFALHFAEILISAISAPIILMFQPTGLGDLLRKFPKVFDKKLEN